MLVAAESVTTTMKHDGVDVDSVVIVVVKLREITDRFQVMIK